MPKPHWYYSLKILMLYADALKTVRRSDIGFRDLSEWGIRLPPDALSVANAIAKRVANASQNFF